jgi:predicted N-acetyltransferase YhbS
MEILYNYRDNGGLRFGLNVLTKKVFDFTFEKWYDADFWDQNSVPFSVVEDGNILANVMAHTMSFLVDGEEKEFIQLGTVMTDPQYRGRGYSAAIFEKLMKIYGDRGYRNFYLFANDSVVDFYPKFGFENEKEYVCKCDMRSSSGKMKLRHIDMNDLSKVKDVVNFAVNNFAGKRVVLKNRGIYGFWLNGNENIYFSDEFNCYVAAEIKDDMLVIYDVFSAHEPNYKKLAEAFGGNYSSVILKFSPTNTAGFETKEYSEQDCNLFIIGDELKKFASEKLIFPEFSHT